MAIAEDMHNLSREMKNLRAERAAMLNQLSRFRSELNANLAHIRGEMRRVTGEACAQSRATRRAFLSGNQRHVRELINAQRADLGGVRCHFRSRQA